AQRRRSQAQGEIVLARDDAIDRHTRRRIDAELGDRWALLNLDHVGVDAERGQRLLDDAGASFELRRRKGARIGGTTQDRVLGTPPWGTLGRGARRCLWCR